MDDLEMFRSIVTRFGDYGYAAIDGRNQIDMAESEQVVSFCGKVDTKAEGRLTLIKINDLEGTLDGIVKYDLKTEGGEVEVTTSYYKYKDGTWKSCLHPVFMQTGGNIQRMGI